MDATDYEIRQKLKSWAHKQQPPQNGRARLIGAVLIGSNKHENLNQLRFNHIPNELFSWTLVYSFGKGVSALKTVS